MVGTRTCHKNCTGAGRSDLAREVTKMTTHERTLTLLRSTAGVNDDRVGDMLVLLSDAWSRSSRFSYERKVERNMYVMIIAMFTNEKLLFRRTVQLWL